MSASDSNHCFKKSTALIVSSLRLRYFASPSRSPRILPKRRSRRSSRGSREPGSGASRSMISLAARHSLVTARLNSGAASASLRENSEISRLVRAASPQRASERPVGMGRK